MSRILALLILFVAGTTCLFYPPMRTFISPISAQWNGCPPGWCAGYAGSGAGSCAASVAYFAATSGQSPTEHNAQDTAICALVSGGFIGTCSTCFDALYFFANSNIANALVNVANPGTFNLTVGAAGCTFSADNGITGNNACYYKTGFIPNSGTHNMTLNNGSLGVCVINSRSTAQTWTAAGSYDGSTRYTLIRPHYAISGNELFAGINDSSDLSQLATTNAQGNNTIVTADPPNAAILQTPIHNGMAGSSNNRNNTGLLNFELYVMGLNQAGTLVEPSADTLGYVYFGASPLVAGVASVRSILSTMLTSIGASNSC